MRESALTDNLGQQLRLLVGKPELQMVVAKHILAIRTQSLQGSPTTANQYAG